MLIYMGICGVGWGNVGKGCTKHMAGTLLSFEDKTATGQNVQLRFWSAEFIRHCVIDVPCQSFVLDVLHQKE